MLRQRPVVVRSATSHVIQDSNQIACGLVFQQYVENLIRYLVNRTEQLIAGVIVTYICHDSIVIVVFGQSVND